MPLATGGGASRTDGALTRMSRLQLARGAVLSVTLPYSDETAWTGATVALAAAVELALASGALAGWPAPAQAASRRSEEHTSELQSRSDLVCRLLLEKKKTSIAVTRASIR